MDDQPPSISIEALLASGAIVAHKDGNYGSFYPRVEEFGVEGVPFLTAKAISNGRIDINNAPRLAEDRVDQLPFGVVQPGDVLLSHNATVGRVAIVPEWNGRLVVGTSLTYFRVDPNQISPRYLAAYFSGRDFQAQLSAVMSHSTRNQVPVTAQRKLRIVLPPMPQQVRIAETLEMFDEKLELAGDMCDVLQAMAQAIFKSWFVDFDPVRAKAEGREPEGMGASTAALFPDSFSMTEYGKVPTGWSFVPALRVFRQSRESVTPARYPTEVFEHFSLPAFDQGKSPKLETGGSIKSNKNSVLSGSILLSKLNPHIPRVWFSEVLGERRAIASTEFLVLLPNEGFSSEYVFAQFSEPSFLKVFSGLTTGTSNSHQRVKVEHLMDLPIICSGPSLVSAFTNIAKPIFDKVKANIRQQATLAELRDTLLPRLISGKLRIPEAERLVEAVL